MKNYQPKVRKTSARKKKVAIELPPDKLKEFKKLEKEKEEAQKRAFCEWLLETHGLKCVPEYKFHPTRRWRIDYYFEGKIKLALEIEGGVFTGGRHTRPQGFIADMEKYNNFTEKGIFLLRATPSDLKIYEFFIAPELLRMLKSIL